MPGDQNTQGQIHASFRFVLDVGGERQGAFTECTLPVVEWEMEEVKEGGAEYVYSPATWKAKNGPFDLEKWDWKEQPGHLVSRCHEPEVCSQGFDDQRSRFET